MRAAVMGAFPNFSARFEGRLDFMYADVLGLVTTGVGNLIDPIVHALVLPWVHKSDGSPASRSEVEDEWHMVKSRTDLDRRGGGAFGAVTSLRLEQAAIDNLVVSKMRGNEETIKGWWPGYDDACADGQMGVHSMSWAMGSLFNRSFPAFTKALLAGDYVKAAAQCHMNTVGNPGLIPRNAANVQLFTNAADVDRNGGDPETLYYPGGVPAGGGPLSIGTGPIVAVLTLLGAGGWWLLTRS
jgi:GH24 family phage-related lysozyme (muramidase)